MTPKWYIYVAGPLNGSGYQHINVRKAIDVAEKLRAHGMIPFVPHLYAAQWAFLHPEHGSDVWLALDHAWLRKCDALLVLPGKSPGTETEIAVAESSDIPIFYDLFTLIDYFISAPATPGFDLAQLQRELKPWVLHNFGERPAWQPLLGLAEEAAELIVARTEQDRQDAIADMIVFAADYCNAMEWNLDALWRDIEREQTNARGYTHIEQLSWAIGHIQHHHLKAEQGIRGSREDHHRRAQTYLTVMLRTLIEMDRAVVAVHGHDAPARVLGYVERTWSKVKQRDWKKNPANAADVVNEVA